MRRTDPGGRQERKSTLRIHLFPLLVILLVAVAEVLAQEHASRRQKLQTASAIEPRRRIIISIPDRQLALVEDGQVVRVYPVAVGARATPTPSGVFEIANRITDPTYYTPGKVVGPGKANPLGTRWIGLSLKGFGIHGTNEPGSIGRRASHGCIRMHKADVEELFELIRVGDVVELHGKRNAELAAIFPAPQAPQAAAPSQVAPGVVLATALPVR